MTIMDYDDDDDDTNNNNNSVDKDMPIYVCFYMYRMCRHARTHTETSRLRRFAN